MRRNLDPRVKTMGPQRWPFRDALSRQFATGIVMAFDNDGRQSVVPRDARTKVSKKEQRATACKEQKIKTKHERTRKAVSYGTTEKQRLSSTRSGENATNNTVKEPAHPESRKKATSKIRQKRSRSKPQMEMADKGGHGVF